MSAALFDIKAAEDEAKKEIADEAVKAAKVKIKSKLGDIAKAKQVLANLEREYDVLMISIGMVAGALILVLGVVGAWKMKG